jgi:hypothetical protein
LCSDHCPDQHSDVSSVVGRWTVQGVRATIVLHTVAPYMRVQGRRARELVEVGRGVGYKTNVVNDMRARGWALPPLREQPRARVELVR